MSEPKGILGTWRITPDNITKLENFEVFVFGSNIEGIHGKGAAKTAMQWGAVRGVGFGARGDTFAIPTRMVDKIVRGRSRNAAIFTTLTLGEIKLYVDRFIEHAKTHKMQTFLVTQIGCGNAGLEPAQIAPLFEEAAQLDNVHLPLIFWESMCGYYPPR